MENQKGSVHVKPLSLWDLSSAFVVLGLGISLAILVFLIERIICVAAKTHNQSHISVLVIAPEFSTSSNCSPDAILPLPKLIPLPELQTLSETLPNSKPVNMSLNHHAMVTSENNYWCSCCYECVLKFLFHTLPLSLSLWNVPSMLVISPNQNVVVRRENVGSYGKTLEKERNDQSIVHKNDINTVPNSLIKFHILIFLVKCFSWFYLFTSVLLVR